MRRKDSLLSAPSRLACKALIRNHRQRGFSTLLARRRSATDPRISRLGTLIEDKFANVRENYETPKNTIVLAHGLFGFDEIRLAGSFFPPIQYWHGIRHALSLKGVKVVTATVPPYGSIETRAEELAKDIAAAAKGDNVNIIAGLDSRYMISKLRPTDFKVQSLTTIATPHRGLEAKSYIARLGLAYTKIGSVIADYFMGYVDTNISRIRQLSKSIDRFSPDAKAFSQLTRTYLQDEFNPTVPDIEDVHYFSYGAMFQPRMFNIFRHFHQLLEEVEGPNDGLVSVASSKWGGDAGYKGTLVGVSHLNLINWTNRAEWLIGEMMGKKKKFNAIAFYLDIADMLAKAGM